MEILAPEFDYSLLDSETRIVVQQRTSEIRTLMGRSAEIVREIGQKLLEVKTRLGHGHFGEWLSREFDWTHKTADRYMLVASKFDNLSNLELASPSALYLLASDSTPEEVKESAIDQIESGKKVTHKQVKAAIQQKLQAGDTEVVNEPAHPLHGQTVTVKRIQGDVAHCESEAGTIPIAVGWLGEQPPEPEVKPTPPKPALSQLLEEAESALEMSRLRVRLLQNLLQKICTTVQLPAALQQEAEDLGILEAR